MEKKKQQTLSPYPFFLLDPILSTKKRGNTTEEEKA